MEIYKYATSNRDKAVALFSGLTAAGYFTSLGSYGCECHGISIYALATSATEPQFKLVRAMISDAFPSTNPELPTIDAAEIPSYLPEEWTK